MHVHSIWHFSVFSFAFPFLLFRAFGCHGIHRLNTFNTVEGGVVGCTVLSMAGYSNLLQAFCPAGLCLVDR